MTKNPAFMALVGVAAVAALIAIVLLALSLAFSRVDGMPSWVALIPAAVAVLAGVGALVLWGTARRPS